MGLLLYNAAWNVLKCIICVTQLRSLRSQMQKHNFVRLTSNFSGIHTVRKHCFTKLLCEIDNNIKLKCWCSFTVITLKHIHAQLVVCFEIKTFVYWLFDFYTVLAVFQSNNVGRTRSFHVKFNMILHADILNGFDKAFSDDQNLLYGTLAGT